MPLTLDRFHKCTVRLLLILVGKGLEKAFIDEFQLL